MNNVPMNPTRQDLIDALTEATDELEQLATSAALLPCVGRIANLRAIINNAEVDQVIEKLNADREMRLSTLLAALSIGKATLHHFDRTDFVGIMVGNLVYACDLDFAKAPTVSDRLLEALKIALGPVLERWS